VILLSDSALAVRTVPAAGTCKQTAADISNASPAPLLTHFGDPRIFRRP